MDILTKVPEYEKVYNTYLTIMKGIKNHYDASFKLYVVKINETPLSKM